MATAISVQQWRRGGKTSKNTPSINSCLRPCELPYWVEWWSGVQRWSRATCRSITQRVALAFNNGI